MLRRNKGSGPRSILLIFLFIRNPFNDISEIAMRELNEFETTVKPETKSFRNGSWIKKTKPGK